MTSFTIFGEVTTPQVLGTGEAGAVTANGNLMVTSQDNAVNMNDFAFLSVSGSIFSALNAVDSIDSGFVSVGTTGVPTAFSQAIHFSGGFTPSTVNNKGIIYGASGVVSDSSGLTVVNAG